MRDIVSNMSVVDLTTATLSGVTPNASAWLDRLGYDGAALELWTGAVTDAGTAAGFTATMQHSDLTTAASAEDVTTDDVNGDAISITVTSDTDDAIIKGGLGYVGGKRYIRLNYVGTTGTNAVVRTVGRLGKPHKAPTVYVGAAVAAT